MTVVKWKFTDLQNATTYVFDVNPNQMSSPVPIRDIQWEHDRVAGYTGRRAGRQPHPWSFSGVIRSPEQYAAFLTWLGKRKKIRVTTDLGQEYIVRLLRFKPKQEAGARNQHAPWRHTYTMECLIFDSMSAIVPAPATASVTMSAPTGSVAIVGGV